MVAPLTGAVPIILDRMPIGLRSETIRPCAIVVTVTIAGYLYRHRFVTGGIGHRLGYLAVVIGGRGTPVSRRRQWTRLDH